MTDFDPWIALAEAKSTLANSSSTLATPCESNYKANTKGYENSSNSSNSSREPPELSQNSGEICKERKKQDIYILQWVSTNEAPSHPPGQPIDVITQDALPARVANLLEFPLNSCKISINADFGAARVNRPQIAVPSPSDILRAPPEWLDGFYALSSADAPCPGFRLSMDWRETFDATHAFLEQHAEQAHVLGWNTLDLFAVHRTVGGNRADCCGALMLAAGSRVSVVESDAIHFARLRDGQPCGRFFRRPHTPEMVPVWSFGR